MILIHVDGASLGNPGPSGAGFVVLRNGQVMHEESIPLGHSTNNRAEYAALIAGLKWLLANNADREDVEIRTDSALLYNHITGRYRVKDPELARLLETVRVLLERTGAKVVWKPRKGNLADPRAKKAAAASRARRTRNER